MNVCCTIAIRTLFELLVMRMEKVTVKKQGRHDSHGRTARGEFYTAKQHSDWKRMAGDG